MDRLTVNYGKSFKPFRYAMKDGSEGEIDMKTCYKGYGPGMICRGKKYEEGHVYEEGYAEACECGMHFCKDPFYVLDYYGLVNENGEFNEFSTVEPLSASLPSSDGKKFCTRKLKIGAKLSTSEFIKVCVDYMIKNRSAVEGTGGSSTKIVNGVNYEWISCSMNYAQIGSRGSYARICSNGEGSTICSSGYHAKIISHGTHSMIGSNGCNSRICNSGEKAVIASIGNYAQISSSGDYALICSSGNYSRVCNIGDFARINSSGDCAVIMCAGHHDMVKAKKGSFITLAEWENSDDGRRIPIHVATKQVDGEEIKEDTFYMLQDGEFAEVEDE